MPVVKKNLVVMIAGPTATGKTDLALSLAQRLLAEGWTKKVAIISADSRQVYRGLEILSGADVPEGFHQVLAKNSQFEFDFFESADGFISLHGVSMLQPNQDWSLGQFRQFGQQILDNAWQEESIPIVVGGTGLYLTKLLSTSPEIEVPPDEKLRSEAQKISLEQLQAKVNRAFPDHFNQLNQSDRQNSRRLVRLYEKAAAGFSSEQVLVAHNLAVEPVWLGVHLPLEQIVQRIEQRVAKRWQQGVGAEIGRLVQQFGRQHDLPVMTATGVVVLIAYIRGQISKEDATQRWAVAERQYAKRQLVWWQKYAVAQPNWTWLEATDSQILDSAWQRINDILKS